jgi:hypothetical protein
MCLGLPLQVKLLDLYRSEGLGDDQRLHVSVQVTAVGEAHLQPVQAALPFLDARLRAEAVFEEQQLAAAFQHPVHFPQCLSDIFDAAQGKRADGAIEAVVLEGEPFAAEFEFRRF